MSRQPERTEAAKRTLIHARVELARVGKNPMAMYHMPSGWAVLCDAQFLRGYSLLLPDPVVPDLNCLGKKQRARFLVDMSLLGDALLEVTGAFRINYEILGNLEPALHAHVIPRFQTEPPGMRKGPVWHYDNNYRNAVKFNLERDRELMRQIAEALRRRIRGVPR